VTSALRPALWQRHPPALPAERVAQLTAARAFPYLFFIVTLVTARLSRRWWWPLDSGSPGVRSR
jgi:hypothetical protein